MSSCTPNIEELDAPPVVGSYYMVPCILDVSTLGSPVRVAWPVTGPLHDDLEFIGQESPHYHYDLRFLSPSQLVLAGNRDRVRRGEPVLSDEELHGIVLVWVSTEPPVRRRLLCRREQPKYKLRNRAPGTAPWLDEMSQHYSRARVKCGRCPHRGLPLSSLPREPGSDVVTCPGHGLRWDLKTGKLVTLRTESCQ